MERLLGYIGHRWKWLVVGAVVGALLGIGSTRLSSDAWVADSLVVLTEPRIPAEEFTAVATAIFPTDPVLGPVVSELQIDETPGSLISSGALAIRSAPGGLAARVVATTQDEALSIGLANAAAASLAQVGEENGLGEIAQFPVQDAQRAKDPEAASALAGMLLGLAVATGVLMLRYLRKARHLPDADRADADVTLRVGVVPPATAGAEGAIEMTPNGALAGLVTGFLARGEASEPITGIVLDEGPFGWATLVVARELSGLAGRGEPASTIAWTPASQPVPASFSRIVVVAPANARSRLDDVRRTLAHGRPRAFVALVLVSAPDLS